MKTVILNGKNFPGLDTKNRFHYGIGEFTQTNIHPEDLDKMTAQNELIIETNNFSRIFFDQILRLIKIFGPQNIEIVELTEKNTSKYTIDFINRMRKLSNDDDFVDKLFGKEWWKNFVNKHLNPIAAGLAFNPALRLPGEIERSIFKSGMCALCFRFIENGKINYLKTLSNLDLFTSYLEQKKIPFKNYDLII